MSGAGSRLAPFEEAAAARLDAPTAAFLAGGAGEEHALAANLEAFARRSLAPRVLVDVSERTTGTTVLGRPVSLPVLIAPVGFQTLFDPEGELATARAAAAVGTIMCVSAISEAAPAEIASAAAGARLWFQVYPLRDRGLMADLLAQAREAGFEAVVLTADGPVIGRRPRAERAGFRAPEGFRVRSTARRRAPLPAASPGELAELLDPSFTWPELDWLAAVAGLPLVLKGVLAGEDARLAREHGVAAVVVSNHGGRQLDAAPAALDVLEEVVAAAGDAAEVLLDGGIRRGSDVLIALALGARAVLVGRPAMWGLAARGEAGVVEVLELLAGELDEALALCGCPMPLAARPGLVRRTPRRAAPERR